MKNSNHVPGVEELTQCPLPFCATRGDMAPLFTAEAYVNRKIKELRLEDYRGKWVVLFFYASDFTFV
ncbi:MAG: redoxin domain-containing protein [Bacillaceae bacterium]|nr:redoxin domain-containing protein [Bacillaceae bacterium]